jgi:hypothetical protein
LPTAINTCIDEYTKYDGSAVALAALAHLVEGNPGLGNVHGVTKDITTSKNPITPDLSVRTADRTGAIFFELKWTLTKSTAQDEILGLRKYLEADFVWTDSKVNPVDVVLIVNEEDADLAVGATNQLLAAGNTYLGSNLAIWKWHYSTGRGMRGEASMWFEKVWGRSSNIELERLISSASGYKTPSDVLTYIRWTFRFTKDKPPIQYIIGELLMNVFSSFRTKTDKREELEITANLTDTVYDRAKTFFAGKDPSSESVQLRKRWVRDALRMMPEIGLGTIRVPYLTREGLTESLCDRIKKYLDRRQRRSGSGRVKRPKVSPFDTRLDSMS